MIPRLPVPPSTRKNAVALCVGVVPVASLPASYQREIRARHDAIVSWLVARGAAVLREPGEVRP